jgi:hypothetical protein
VLLVAHNLRSENGFVLELTGNLGIFLPKRDGLAVSTYVVQKEEALWK